MTYSKAPRAASLMVAAGIGVIAGCGGSSPASPDATGATVRVAQGAAASSLSITTVSNRPDMVSGGDVLARVTASPGRNPADVTIELNGADVTSAFRAEAGNALVGLVTGLRTGANELVARYRDGNGQQGNRATLQVVNHAASGPVFSGPQEQPFYCQTHQFRLYPGGPFLTSAPLSAPCEAPTRIDHVYRNTAGAMLHFDRNAPLPADLSYIETNEGRRVPYVVRLETGVVNRAVYQIAILEDPGQAAAAKYPGWNQRLVYTFGGGCSGGQYIQGSSHGGVLEHDLLSRGFAVASASLNVYRNNCNDVLSAETAMMVKEKFIETYGPVRYTIGWGSSGGAVQQYTIADNYPGILDGIVPRQSFPDLVQTVVVDARLLLNYYNNAPAGSWTQDAITRASGFATFGQINNNGVGNSGRYEAVQNRPGWPNAVWNAIVPAEVRYDPVLNPTGARPTSFDHNVNTYGKDERGFAFRPLDNVGVQYGLAALNAGQITPTQFLDLNDRIGGYDIDLNFIPGRTEAPARALQAAYATGRVLSGGGGLKTTPVLDVDSSYGDQRPTGDVHLRFHHFSTRERILQANGSADNVVMWSGAFGTSAAAVVMALDAMDQWLSAIEADKSSATQAVKTVRNKPATLTDGCYSNMAFIAERQFHGRSGTSQCNTLYPSESYPLEAAGGPLVNNILKCQLRPVDLADYTVTFTDQEKQRLAGIFPNGVCDWSRPGVEQRPLLGTWLRYTGIGTYEPTGR
jgi:hypothetical protein